MEMEEGRDFALQQNEQDQQDASSMLHHFKLERPDFHSRWVECCAKNPRAMIHPLPLSKNWSSIIHAVAVVHSPEHLQFACQWLQHLNISIGTHEYTSYLGACCSLVHVAFLYSLKGQHNEKLKILLEFGATLPDEELEGSSEWKLHHYNQVKQIVDEKRARVARAALVILSMHRFTCQSHGKVSCFKLVGRDMTRLISQEVYHSLLYLWPD